MTMRRHITLMMTLRRNADHRELDEREEDRRHRAATTNTMDHATPRCSEDSELGGPRASLQTQLDSLREALSMHKHINNMDVVDYARQMHGIRQELTALHKKYDTLCQAAGLQAVRGVLGEDHRTLASTSTTLEQLNGRTIRRGSVRRMPT